MVEGVLVEAREGARGDEDCNKREGGGEPDAE
jgi:hypothetical protein